MRIAIGSDERTYLTDFVIEDLRRRGHELETCGALADIEEALWPLIGRKLGELVASGACDEGISFCYTGTGASIVANKVPGVRAALCTDAVTAAGARQYNHANVLALGLRLTSPEIAKEILDAWFSTPFGGGKDAECVAQVNEIDRTYHTTSAG